MLLRYEEQKNRLLTRRFSYYVNVSTTSLSVVRSFWFIEGEKTTG